ncbi:hypothetical protein ACOJUR_12665 [Alicyclobacillus tolerans]|uniref:Uncharacterized protein n=1 Tax=Alicyclobacillus tolerans TaxID=90970 RepID=A0ABT9LSJ1_9BACL|nr:MULTISPECIES: hypothetical protein [Alicyclobacillus]MDP9727232.1 hypothetical protein [Alicyclobacillus tengchongensis]QRF22992.1 hypothetical protein FY534_04330 [Alicyclobacillus sp. TC]
MKGGIGIVDKLESGMIHLQEQLRLPSGQPVPTKTSSNTIQENTDTLTEILKAWKTTIEQTDPAIHVCLNPTVGVNSLLITDDLAACTVTLTMLEGTEDVKLTVNNGKWSDRGQAWSDEQILYQGPIHQSFLNEAFLPVWLTWYKQALIDRRRKHGLMSDNL